MKSAWTTSLACLLVMMLVGSTQSNTTDADTDNDSWRRNSLWDDGQAEFATYEITWQRYDRLYHGRAVLVLVKEPWAPDLQVKADTPRPGCRARPCR